MKKEIIKSIMENLEKEEYSFEGNFNEMEEFIDDFINEYYDTDNYICDMIAKYADDNTDVYYSDLWESGKDVAEYVTESIKEEICDANEVIKDRGIEGLFAIGQYTRNEQVLYINIDEIIYNSALKYLEDILEEKNEEDLEKITIDENDIREITTTIDSNNMFSAIKNEIEEMVNNKIEENQEKIIRENYNEEQKVLTRDEFKEDLLFQLQEDIETLDEYNELKEDSYDGSYNTYIIEKFNRLVNEVDEGYNIEILGDTYFKESK